VGKTKRGKGTKRMAGADRTGPPRAVPTAAAPPPEVPLVPDTLVPILTPERPERLLGDQAYDSAPLDAPWAAVGIAMIAPPRANRTPPATQDGRPWRRYRRRWKMERWLAWWQTFRRLVVRYAYHAANFLGFVHLGWIVILLRCY
jgi:transposase